MRIKWISEGKQLLTITPLRVFNGLSESCDALTAGRERGLAFGPTAGRREQRAAAAGGPPEYPQKKKKKRRRRKARREATASLMLA